jgi:hypothetical protein
MAIESYELVSYAVSLASSGGGGALRPAATIHARGRTEAGAPVEVYLRYYLEPELPPASRLVGEDGARTYMVSYFYGQLPDAVDLLRYEKPMFFSFNDKSNVGYLATSDEPVGEGDVDADAVAAAVAAPSAAGRKRPAAPPWPSEKK